MLSAHLLELLRAYGKAARCEECDHIRIAYNSCRNRHCPKCQGAAAKETRRFHLVFWTSLIGAGTSIVAVWPAVRDWLMGGR
jgi:hypothetical protein